MGKLAGFISAGIGLAVEAVQASLEEQQQLQRPQASQGYTYDPRLVQQPTPGNYAPVRSVGGPSERPRHYHGDPNAPPPTYEESQRQRHNSNTHNNTPQSSRNVSPRLPPLRLTCPIIIPQRRPEDKSRGWMLSYAPVLQNFGIDQNLFLRYLAGFNAESKVIWFLLSIS